MMNSWGGPEFVIFWPGAEDEFRLLKDVGLPVHNAHG